MSEQAKKSVSIFISYNHQDDRYEDELQKHLRPLRRQGLISDVFDGSVNPGTNYQDEVSKRIETADIILLLVSADYLASDFIYEVEMKIALERHERREARAIPIILRPCDWSSFPIGKLQALPSGGRPVSQWDSLDKAFVEIAGVIRAIINEILSPPSNPILNPQNIINGSPGEIPNVAQNIFVNPPPIDIAQTPQSPQNGSAPAQQQSSSLPDPTQTIQVPQAIFKQGAPDAMKVTTDKAVRSLLEDDLEFGIWIEALGSFILSPDTTTPLTIGIEGPWGTGKSSFMYMLKDLLDPSWRFLRSMKEIALPSFAWLIRYTITFPVWLIGKGLARWGKFTKERREEIVAGLSFDPEIDENIKLEDFSRRLQFWARLAKWHSRRRPKRNPTVWFNAWKFEEEEQLWAALALAVLDQIKERYNIVQRFFFWFSLTLRRFSFRSAAWQILVKVLFPILLGVIAWKFSFFFNLAVGTYHGNPGDFLPALPIGQTVLAIGAVMSGIVQISSIVKDPFQISIKDVIDKPDYKQKVGFIGSFEDDFAAIVSTITKPRFGWKQRKLIIFIDDLDRCKLPKAVDILEGINLFLDSEHCVFILGMDTTAVVASIETKYSALFKQIRQERADITSVGRLFLEKIIQIPIRIPSSTKEGIERLATHITERGIRPLQEYSFEKNSSSNRIGSGRPDLEREKPTGPLSNAQINTASYSRDDVRNAIIIRSSLFQENPRLVKRFINLFRLYIYIANAQALFEEEQHTGLTMDRLAVWVAWSMRWGNIANYLVDEVDLTSSSLVTFLADIANKLDPRGCWEHSTNGGIGPSAFKILTDSVSRTQQIQKSKSSGKSHWCNFPWEFWLRDPDFLKCIKLLESFWNQLQPSKTNWLQSMLFMTRMTTATEAVPAPDTPKMPIVTEIMTTPNASTEPIIISPEVKQA